MERNVHRGQPNHSKEEVRRRSDQFDRLQEKRSRRTLKSLVRAELGYPLYKKFNRMERLTVLLET